MIVTRTESFDNSSVSIQKRDIAMIKKLNIDAPLELYLPFINNEEIVNDENQYDFLEYTDSEVIGFLLTQEWLVFYNKFANLNSYEFELLKNNILSKITVLESTLNNNLELEDEYKEYLKNEINKNKYFLESICYLEKLKSDGISPEVLAYGENRSK